MRRALLVAFLLAAGNLYAANPAVVQCTTLKKETSPVMSSSASFSRLPTVGNKIKFFDGQFLVGSTFTTNPTVYTDNQSGNSYAVDTYKRATTGDGSGNYYKVDAASGYVVGSSGTYTVTVAAADGYSVYWAWQACEISGLTSSSSLDKVGTAENTSSSTTITVTASGANAQNCEFVSALIYDGNGGNAASGYTQLLADTTLLGMQAGYKVINTAQTSAASWNFSSFGNALAILTTDKGTACNSAVQRRTPNSPRTGTRTAQ